MKQSTKSFIKKNSKKYVSVGSPVEENNLVQITDVAEENGIFKYSTDNGQTYNSAPFPTTADIDNMGSDRKSPYARQDYVYKISVSANTTISNVVVPYGTKATIFWGDGETTEAREYSGSGNYSYSHTYTEGGTYFITYYLEDTSGYIMDLQGLYPDNSIVEDVKIPDNTYRIESFGGMQIQGTLTIPKNTIVAEDCLGGTYFTKVKLEGNNSGVAMFRGMTYLKEVEGLENFATTNGNLLFQNCSALERVALGSKPTSLNKSFEGTSSLKSVFIPSTVTTIAAETFKNANSTAVIYCEANSKPAGWDTYWAYYDATHELTVKWGYSKEQYLTEINGGLIDKDILNNRSTAQDKTYSANYINSNFVPLSFTSRLYATRTGAGAASLQNTKPTLDNLNYISATTTNTDFNWSTPDITLTRTLENEIVLNATNSFAIDLYFGLNRGETITFGAKIKVTTDGATWNYISTQQSFASKTYTTDLSSEDFVVYTDALTSETTYPIGSKIAIEIYKKQDTATSLTTDYYCGVDIDGAGIYSFVEFNFANVNINTEQIEDGAVTKQKLSQDVQDDLDAIATKQDTLVSGTNIKTINSTTVLGAGNFDLVEKTSSINKVYGTDSNGDQTTYTVANSSSTGGAIALYDANGRLKAATPNANDDVANKKYVDDAIASAITTALNTPV